MNLADQALDQLAPRSLPASAWQPDWLDVLRRANAYVPNTRRRRRPARRAALVAAALAAVVIPLVALAAVNDWWFFDFRDAPAPVNKPVVVTQGSWSGHPWRLVAYNSQSAGTCWSITFDESTPAGGAIGVTPGTGFAGKAANVLSCGSIVGLRFPHTATAEQPIAYATGASWDGSYPSWIAGPVVGAATTVVIRFRNGAILRLPNVSPPQSLGRLRWFGPIGFYAAPLPTGVRIDERPLSLAGLDSRGGVVACLVPGPADDHGWSPLADCAGSSDR